MLLYFRFEEKDSIIEWFGLEGTIQDHLVQPSCHVCGFYFVCLSVFTLHNVLFLRLKTKIEVDLSRKLLGFQCIKNVLHIIRHFQLIPAE